MVTLFRLIPEREIFLHLLKHDDPPGGAGFCTEARFSKGFAVSIDTSSIMSLVPIIGAVVTLVVFSLLMYACIRNVDQAVENAALDDVWDDDESVADRRVGEGSS